MEITAKDIKKLIIAFSSGFFLLIVSVIGSAVYSAVYSSGVSDTDMEYMKLEIDQKPDNAVMMEYVNLLKLQFEFLQKSQDIHITSNKERWAAEVRYNEAITERIKRIEDIYLTDKYRGVKKK